MSRRAPSLVLAALVGGLALGCSRNDAPTVDPEAQRLDPPVMIIDDPPPEPAPEAVADTTPPPAALVADPSTEVITFTGEDADPGMADEVTGSPQRDPLPSMMSDVLHGPNK